MRLIDADAKITALLYDEEHEETKRAEMTIADFLDSHTEEGCPQSGLISINDHPPKKGEDVIIYGYYVGLSGETYPVMVISDIEEFKGYGYVPIAWMPLPEPLKEVTTDD